MDYKKAYEEALERAKEFVGKDVVEAMEYVFPELADSEDERIRKELIKETEGSGVRLFETVTNEEFIAWLEKQKPAEWSYENEKRLENICNWIRDYPRLAKFKPELFETAKQDANWLNSLKRRLKGEQQ